MEKLGLMERFADPMLFVDLTSGEKLIGGLVTTLMGMGITFVILFLLWGVIAFVSRIVQKNTSSPLKNKAIQADSVSLGENVSLKEDEIIAVIAAAVAVDYGERFELKNMKITRVKENHKKNKWIKPKPGIIFSVESVDITIQ